MADVPKDIMEAATCVLIDVDRYHCNSAVDGACDCHKGRMPCEREVEIVARYLISERERRTAHGVTVPEGWALVPIEPTLAMLKEIHLDDAFTMTALGARYRAMLAAAPSLSTSAGGGERG